MNYIAGLSQSLTASKIDLGTFGFTSAVFRLKKYSLDVHYHSNVD